MQMQAQMPSQMQAQMPSQARDSQRLGEGEARALQRPPYFERSPEPLEAAARTLSPSAGFAELFASALRARDL